MGDFFYLRVTMTEKILILDFGSQYTQLIARAVREANVYCEIIPYHKTVEFDPSLKGIILSGSPFSVNDTDAPVVDIRGVASAAAGAGHMLWGAVDGQIIWRERGEKQ